MFGDFNNDGFHDLVIGAPRNNVVAVSGTGQNAKTVEDAGLVNVIYGSESGLRTLSHPYWSQLGIETAGTHFTQGYRFTSFSPNENINSIPSVIDYPEKGDLFGFSSTVHDFNNDAYDDVAITSPYEGVGNPFTGDKGGVSEGGAIYVLFGSAGGLQEIAPASQGFSQDTINRFGGQAGNGSEEKDRFGYSVASGDFDNDGYGDLVVGVPFEDDYTEIDAGAVNVIYGSAKGFELSNSQMLSQDSLGVDAPGDGGSEHRDLFGYSLAVGDFNRDGHDDLAIGVPSEDASEKDQNSGKVNILLGTTEGLFPPTLSVQKFLTQDMIGQYGGQGGNGSEVGDSFGSSLAAADFNNDGYADLAVGAPNEDDVATQNAGAVNVVYGGFFGLNTVGSQMWSQDSPGVNSENGSEVGDQFGRSLAAGNFNGDEYDDLAIGIPSENVLNTVDAGAVLILHGSKDGLVAQASQIWTQDHLLASKILFPSSIVAQDRSEPYDMFGQELSVGDYNKDGYHDLAIGVPHEDKEWTSDSSEAGIVHILYGSSSGLTAEGNELWSQDGFALSGLIGGSEGTDLFGFSLA